jgi:glycine cleavage system H protein
MLPGVYGFTWDAGNVLFLGIFFTVATVIAGTVTLAGMRAYKDHLMKRHESIRWMEDFHDLPQSARACRHVLTGELKQRTCPNGFDCRVCAQHEALLGQRQASADSGEKKNPAQPARALGFSMPLDRLYHRGHTWVRLEADGTATVGLDDFCTRVFGKPDRVELPPVGADVRVNHPGWKMQRQDSVVRILAPIDGTVTETGSAEKGWYLKVQPLASIDTRHLLHGEEVQPWIASEMERLQASLRGIGLASMLADGGEPVADFPESAPDADWDDVWAEMFLEP